MIDILLFFSSSGEWVNQGEAFLTSDDEPAQFNEDSAALLNQKIDDHKQFFENYERTMEQLKQWTAKAGPDVPAEQLQSLVKRFVYFLIFNFFDNCGRVYSSFKSSFWYIPVVYTYLGISLN